MSEVDEQKDSESVAKFEEMFRDRFTEEDSLFMELKSKNLTPPAVIHPWRIAQKQWNKKWDYSPRNQDGYRNNGRQHYKQNPRDDHHNSSQDGECSNFRSRSYESYHDVNRDRSYHREMELRFKHRGGQHNYRN
ncbi:RNA guanine-N7 methyltransferase activating subunit-like [Uloborus diversus]|uniref:RNA guanine-N7 methyltransferase activating subunit-like n=1 Tax=Uloborus diversus TaxID=327109 RepID=UPI0024094A22|nr:RNA guanine-N7 methyltransferase activating subunit-like [Uloborus diversus]